MADSYKWFPLSTPFQVELRSYNDAVYVAIQVYRSKANIL
jgi:hypothetical protein